MAAEVDGDGAFEVLASGVYGAVAFGADVPTGALASGVVHLGEDGVLDLACGYVELFGIVDVYEDDGDAVGVGAAVDVASGLERAVVVLGDAGDVGWLDEVFAESGIDDGRVDGRGGSGAGRAWWRRGLGSRRSEEQREGEERLHELLRLEFSLLLFRDARAEWLQKPESVVNRGWANV